MVAPDGPFLTRAQWHRWRSGGRACVFRFHDERLRLVQSRLFALLRKQVAMKADDSRDLSGNGAICRILDRSRIIVCQRLRFLWRSGAWPFSTRYCFQIVLPAKLLEIRACRAWQNRRFAAQVEQASVFKVILRLKRADWCEDQLNFHAISMINRTAILLPSRLRRRQEHCFMPAAR